jgi:hypothetical protein
MNGLTVETVFSGYHSLKVSHLQYSTDIHTTKQAINTVQYHRRFLHILCQGITVRLLLPLPPFFSSHKKIKKNSLTNHEYHRNRRRHPSHRRCC